MKLSWRFVTAVAYLFANSLTGAELHASGDQTVNQQFQQMKSLIGQWRASSDGREQMVTFRLVADGSALMETQSGGGDGESITIIYPAGGELRADHYCHLKSQSRLIASANAYSGLIRFQLRDPVSATPHSRYHGALMVRFIDPHHHTEFWRETDDSGKTIRLVGTRFTRVH